MSLNPLNELKRRLDDDDIPLPKRLCLAKNVTHSHHFPTAPKERVVADWLQALAQKNKLSGDDLRSILSWLNVSDDLTSEFKSKLILIVSQYLKKNQLQNDDVQHLQSFLENPKLLTQFSLLIEDSLFIAITLLQHLKCEENDNLQISQRVFNNIIKFFKESKKKLEFIVKFLDGENLETVFSYLDSDRDTVINACENILFPKNKKSFFASYLQTLVRKNNIDDLISEKGDNIQSVLKIMDSFFTFPNGRTCMEPKFLCDFVDVFVSCYRAESQLIFAFYVMIANCLQMEQGYLIPAMTMNPISFDVANEAIKRNLFLQMLDILLKNEVDISVRLSDTLGVKISKVETKKTFLLFLESVMRGQLKMEGKPDKTTFDILKTALKLDPSIVEPKIEEILPPLMCGKKTASVMESYSEMMNFMLETFFKLGRGTVFLNKILPLVRHCLDTGNTEQSSERKSRRSSLNQDDKKNKALAANNVFPEESVELYGKLTSELMFRQNKELLASLQKDFEDLCLSHLNVENLSLSTITLTEVMSSILSSFFKHCKMADHTVPLNIAEEFWDIFKDFEANSLQKLGKYLIEKILDCNQQLINSFLKLCLNFSYLKLLNIKYSNAKLLIPYEEHTSEVFDMTILLPCLMTREWTNLASNVTDDEAVLILDELLAIKIMAIEVLRDYNSKHNEETISQTKSYLIKHLNDVPQLLEPRGFLSKVLLANLDKSQLKHAAKTIVKQYMTDCDIEIFANEAITNNKLLLNALLLETVKNILKCFNNTESLARSVTKSDFDFIAFTKENDMTDLFGQISITEESTDSDIISSYVEILKKLQIYYLEETYQLLAIFVLLGIKNNSQKKLRKNVDYVLQSTFELSSQPPDLYKIFPVEFIFSFKDILMIDLLSLKIKTSNNFLVIKCLLESAVRRVKVEKELVTSIVELILSKQSKVNSASIEIFADPAFQMSCIILPLIVKQKKVITLSAYRSILAELQEKLHKSLLECFKNINFKNNSSFSHNISGNIDDSMVVSDSTMATLNAISAYSLTLSKCCESSDVEEFKNLDYIWSALEYFLQSAVQTVQNPESKYQHVESSIQLLNTVLRYIKKLEYHEIFQTKDKIFTEIWKSIKARLLLVLDENSGKKCIIKSSLLEEIAVTIKFLCEWVSVEGFVGNFVQDISSLSSLEFTKSEAQSRLTSLQVSKYLLTQILKANLIGPKCVALSKLIYQNSRNLKSYIHENYESEHMGVIIKSKKKKISVEFQSEETDEIVMKTVKMDDVICEMIKISLGTITEAILAAKKINLDYKSMDSIFEAQHAVHFILGHNTLRLRCEISWQAFFKLFEASVAVLNSLLVSREELLEDRWPCYMQCYRALINCLCSRSSTHAQMERSTEEKLGEMAHSLEKLTQSICKRKTHVSKIAAYSVADICSTLERFVPTRTVRQHLENSIAMFIQASDTTHAMAFLRRALAGTAGQMTMTNMYTMYKRYHKYVGNA